MPTYYDLLKYTRTGIASPNMTAYDKLRALEIAGGAKEQTLTGVPPISFVSKTGKPLVSWSMLGNGQQTGTPTPDAPIMPQFVGVRTAQLFDVTAAGETNGKYINAGGQEISNSNWKISGYIEITGNAVTISGVGGYSPAICAYDEDKNYVRGISYSTAGDLTTKTIDITDCKYVRFSYHSTMNPMLNTGSTALPYEPYGWAEKITCAGQTTPVYLGQVSTVRRIKKLVLTGEEAIATYDPTYSRFSIIIQGSLIVGVCLSPAICTHYQVISDGSYIANVPNNAIYSDSGNARWFIKTTDYTTVDDFKAYLAAQYAAGTPVVIWYVLAEPETAIVNEPLCKIGDYADELSSADASVTIPTVEGENTLTVDGDLQPSSMTITYT